MDAREYMEWMAYQAMEEAAAERQEQRRVMRRAHTTANTPTSTPPTPHRGVHRAPPHRTPPPQHRAVLHKSSSCVDGAFTGGTNGTADTLTRDVRSRLHISKSTTSFSQQQQNGTSHLRPHSANNATRSGMRKRLSDNFEHYTNMLQEVALPMLFRRTRSRSRSRDKTKRRDQNSNRAAAAATDAPIEEDYDFVEHIELTSMSDGGAPGSQGGALETGRGHAFTPLILKAPTWCDKCGDFIWGVYKQCLKCTNCEYTCHHECRGAVTLDCAGQATPADISQSETSLSEATATSARADDADSGYHTGSSTLQKGQKGRRPPGEWTLTREDLRTRIESFNNNNHGLIMSLQQETNTFQGFIRVHMNLIRPINMSLSTRPTSIYDVIGQGEEEGDPVQPGDDSTQITSFYLPKDTTKVIHINSDTTTQEVIKALLSKFKITDNPRKFALYEKLMDPAKKDAMRRMEDDECPLPLCLCWTAEGLEGLDARKFLLQENDTGEIMWEAFSLPELENFLKILNREEEEYIDQLRHKYRTLKIHMKRRLVELERTRAAAPGEGKRQPVYV